MIFWCWGIFMLVFLVVWVVLFGVKLRMLGVWIMNRFEEIGFVSWSFGLMNWLGWWKMLGLSWRILGSRLGGRWRVLSILRRLSLRSSLGGLWIVILIFIRVLLRCGRSMCRRWRLRVWCNLWFRRLIELVCGLCFGGLFNIVIFIR